MKKIFAIYLLGLSIFSLKAQDKPYEPYEVLNNMPAFYGQLKEQLTFPMAWDKTKGVTFDQWRTQARGVLMECMEMLPPAPEAYDMQLLAIEKRNGYEVQKILFNVSGWSRIPAYLLIP